jgi:hypothetical protein
MANKINPEAFTEYGRLNVGRLKFYGFATYLKEGIQFYPYATIYQLQTSWKITKRLLNTRAKPRLREGELNGVSGIYIFRKPRIVGEESLMKRLAALKFTSERAMSL